MIDKDYLACSGIENCKVRPEDCHSPCDQEGSLHDVVSSEDQDRTACGASVGKDKKEDYSGFWSACLCLISGPRTDSRDEDLACGLVQEDDEKEGFL